MACGPRRRRTFHFFNDIALGSTTDGQTEVPGPAVAKRSGVPAVVQAAIHNKNKKEDASRTSSIALVSLQECYLDTEALSRISDSLNC